MKKLPFDMDAVRDGIQDLPRSSMIAAATVVVVIIGAYVAFNTFLGSAGDKARSGWDAAYEQMANDVARAVGLSLTPYHEAISAVATNADVRAALIAMDGAKLADLATELQPEVAGVQRLRLLGPNVRDAVLDETPPLTYASVSLMRKAKSNDEKIKVEIHLVGHEGEHLVFVDRVMSGDGEEASVIGFAHLSVDPRMVRQILLDNPPKGVYAEIRQGAKVRIAATGQAPGGEVPSTISRISGTALAVKLSAEGAAPAAESGVLPIYVPVLAIAALLVGLFLFQARRPAVGIATAGGNTVIYAGAIKAILDGAHPGLEQLIPGSRAPKTDFDMSGLDDTLEGDDVTTLKPAQAVIGEDDPTVPSAGDSPAADDAPADSEAPAAADPVPASIFRSYDIRGVVDETLTEEGVYQIGRALGAEAEARGQKTVVIARDGRHSSEPFMQALSKGLLESGRDVLDIGLVPTPVLYFATHHLDARSGVMITGSHNPKQYNGLKIVLDGETLSGEAIQAIRRRVEEQDFVDGTGSMQSTDIVTEYIRRISEEIPVSLGNTLKVVVDCGNGVPGAVAPDILRAIGHDVIEVFCDVDGDFPNHHPDPADPANLETLIQAVADEGADLGLAFDGDGDRLGVVDAGGQIIWPDRQMILFSRDILSRNPGAKIIFDVKCSRLLAADIAANGGEAIMAKTGHSLIKAKMQETDALLAGEMSGHIFFKERWYGFDDAIYSAARLLEILVNSSDAPADVFSQLPGGVATPELKLDMPEEQHASFMEQVLGAAQFDDGEVSTIDGMRVDFDNAWGLIRPSNTTPCLVLRFEGDDEASLENVKERFRTLLNGIDAGLSLPF